MPPAKRKHKLIAQYRGECRRCRREILPGQKILFAPKESVEHYECPAPPVGDPIPKRGPSRRAWRELEANRRAVLESTEKTPRKPRRKLTEEVLTGRGISERARSDHEVLRRVQERLAAEKETP